MSEGSITALAMATALVLITLIITIGALIHQREDNNFYKGKKK